MANKTKQTPTPTTAPPAQKIKWLDPIKVIASINNDEPFKIIGENLSEDIKLCASYNGSEVGGIDIVVDKNSTNSERVVNAIVTPTDKTPLSKRNTDLEVSIKDAGGIISSKGVLFVSS